MALLISIFLGLKGLAIILGTVISTGGSGNVSLDISGVELKGNTAWIEVGMKGIYSPELSEFLESGTGIPLILEASLISDKGRVANKTYSNFLKYDLIKKHYEIIKSGDTALVEDKAEAKKIFPHFKVPLFSMNDLEDENSYQIKISCRLGKVNLDILDMKEFDLMSLWNFKTPTLETKMFRKKDLVPGVSR